MSLRALPATADRWDDVVRVLGARSAGPGACWCQRFLDGGEPDHREALRMQLAAAAVPFGLIASDGDDAVGWTRVIPRTALPGVRANRAVDRVLRSTGARDGDGGWWVACVVVRRAARGRGVGALLLEAAVEWAREHGATHLDGPPGGRRTARRASLGRGALHRHRADVLGERVPGGRAHVSVAADHAARVQGRLPLTTGIVSTPRARRTPSVRRPSSPSSRRRSRCPHAR